MSADLAEQLALHRLYVGARMEGDETVISTLLIQRWIFQLAPMQSSQLVGSRLPVRQPRMHAYHLARTPVHRTTAREVLQE